MKKNTQKNNPLNVLLLNDSFPPILDGVSNTVLNYANIINNNYGKAIVATPDYPDADDSVYPFDVVRYPSLPTEKLFGYRSGLPLDIPNLSKLIDKDIDIIHTHCPIASTFFARSLKEAINVPMILTYHTKFDIDIAEIIHSKLLQKAAIDVIMDNINAADEVWAVSKGASENLKALGYKGNIVIMPNGCDLELGKAKDEDIQQLIKQHSLRKESIKYLFVGRMKWYKGIKIILDALSMLKKDQQDFQMIFVGDSNEINEIKEYAKELDIYDDCIFVGSINDRKLLKAYYSLADLFLFPSTFDTNGIVVTEAASSYTASVLVKGSAASENATNELDSLLIEENAESMYKALSTHTKQDFEKLGINASKNLYCSWQDSVRWAYEKYRIVLENYQQTNKKLTLDLNNNFFIHFGNIVNAFAFVKNVRLAFKNIHSYAKEQLHDVMDRYL